MKVDERIIEKNYDEEKSHGEQKSRGKGSDERERKGSRSDRRH